MTHTVIEEGVKFNLVHISDRSYSPQKNYYYLEGSRKLQNIYSSELKNYNKDLSVYNVHSRLIDEDGFLMYLEHFHPEANRETVLFQYCKFLSGTNKKDEFMIIRNYGDIDSILLKFPKSGSSPLPVEHVLSNVEMLIENYNNKDQTLCWFLKRGIVAIDMQMDRADELVKTEFVGYLGNEFIKI